MNVEGARGRAAAGPLGDAAVPRLVQPGHRRGRRGRRAGRPTSVSASAGTSASSPCSPPLLGALSVRRFLAVDTARRRRRGAEPRAAGLDRAAHAAHRGDGAGDGAHRGRRQRLAGRRDGRRVRRSRLARRRRVRAVRRRDDAGRVTGTVLLDALRPAAGALGQHGGRRGRGAAGRARARCRRWSRSGIVLWGVGASLGFPVGMSAAADDPAKAAARVSVVSTIGYTAFLAGPPLLGFLGSRFGVLNALLVVAVDPGAVGVRRTGRPRASRRPLSVRAHPPRSSPPNPELDQQRRRGLRRMRTLAVSLLLFAAVVYVADPRPGRLPRLRERRRRGVDGRRHRRLVRGHRALQAPAGAADPAHRADPATQGDARPQPRGVRRGELPAGGRDPRAPRRRAAEPAASAPGSARSATPAGSSTRPPPCSTSGWRGSATRTWPRWSRRRCCRGSSTSRSARSPAACWRRWSATARTTAWSTWPSTRRTAG